MDVSTSSALVTLIGGLLVGLYLRYRNIYSYWDAKHVEGPKPMYVVGHMLEILNNCKTGFTRKCVEKYGRVYGIFEGSEPTLAIADAEVARQICIRDFDAFPNHKRNDLSNKMQDDFIFSARDDHWRRIRALMSPTFTSGKMRRMVKLLQQCVDDLVLAYKNQINGNQNGAMVNLKETYSLYTMDAITTCCYALKLERGADVKDIKSMASLNRFAAQCMELFKLNYMRLIVLILINHKLLRWFGFNFFPEKKINLIVKQVKSIIEGRRKSGQKFDDYLQLLINSRLSDKVDLDEFDVKENHHAALTNESIKSDQRDLLSKLEQSGKVTSVAGLLDDDEILSNAVFIMLVGLETTANLLTNCTYALAHHKDVQQKLRDEIGKICEKDEQGNRMFDYEAITGCQYLDAVVCETLRTCSPLTLVDRVCNRDYYIEKYNINLPKGSKVSIMLDDIMNDPEYWPEPARFDPERFMSENRQHIVPGAYCPFGIGPRHCLGMRFSLTESKLALVKMVMEFEFLPAPNMTYPPKCKPNRTLNEPFVMMKTLKFIDTK